MARSSSWPRAPSRWRRPIRRPIREMMGRVPLLDEIVVVDSSSSDRTREIAEAEGARVVQHPDVLSRYGSFRGKGEALWKSLHETSGDVIAWADTDRSEERRVGKECRSRWS